MGTYFPMSNNQRDAASMLYSKDPAPASHSSTPILTGNTIMYMNFPPSSEPFSDAIASSCMDAPPVASNSNASSQEVLLNFGGSRALESQLNTWKDRRNEMLMMHQAGGSSSCVLQGGPSMQGQGLSLSLSTHVPLHVPYQNEGADFSSILGSNALMQGEDRGRNISFENEDNSFAAGFAGGNNGDGASDMSSYGMPSIARAVPNSKYLRAAQELLDEVVNVKKAIKEQNARKELRREGEGELKDGGSDPSFSATPKETGASRVEISAAEKQELQNKLTKLLTMLDEVDRRYRQYYHQMQIVVSSFDVIAGSGAAKPYTALALQTISRHFRCLHDAINGQIQVARRSLGEEDASSNERGVGISRLRYVDQQLRQQRALQQLGMMQQHAWRPQRGLPESSVSILRAWLFEHFLHPYPKDSEKIMLARQTGLTRSQVSNWFINARVRLWKPMVEEMYKEETGDADVDSNSSSETNPRASKPGAKASEDKAEDLQHGTASARQQLMEPKGVEMNDVEMMGSDANSIFQSEYGVGKGEKAEHETGLFQDAVAESSCGSERFMGAGYHISELERFGSVGGGVSLTLGLQQCEGGGRMAMPNSNHNAFIPLRETDVYNTAASAMGGDPADFECMDSGGRQHRLVSSLLPSFT
ncbi:BEL1-like homeodomain protein 7 [Salvia hispanica]|uniref:BEL1-like homeodomain protein 7 n=1 Tax=Salvia hispanica TaxID=49212 RepID=UPI0020092745|nr:BEL1-like homeodomain protein 7 [Salvia hispanica]